MKALLIASTLILAPITASLTSCASMNASSTEPLLSASGFKPKMPSTDKQKELYDQLPAYKLQRGTYEGKTFYAYKDEKQGVAYVGGQDEYEKYQQIATQREIARDQRIAAEMHRDMAYGWWGAYRPYYYPFY